MKVFSKQHAGKWFAGRCLIFAVDNQTNTETSCEDKAAFKYGKTKDGKFDEYKGLTWFSVRKVEVINGRYDNKWRM